MVAIVDPNGTPVPIYTESGTTIQTVSATGTTFGAAAQIVAPSGHSVVIVDTVDNSDTGVILPVGANIGDIVEIYPIDYFAQVYPTTGESIDLVSSPSPSQVGQNAGRYFRKVSATQWRTIG